MIDLDRYPVHALDGREGRALVARCRAALAAEGACNLPGFLRPEAAARLARESEAWLPQAMVKSLRRNCYFSNDDPTLPPDHPRRRMFHISARQVAYDIIPADAGINGLYLWDALTDFIAAALGKPRLYRFLDQFQAVNVVYLDPGDSQAWHFDQNAYTITLLLQAPERGGAFEYVPNVRSAGDENFAGVARVLDGAGEVRTLARDAGTLTLFLGENSLHRVTKVEGARQRITAILLYDEVAGRVAPDEININIYGERARRILERQRAG